MYNSIIYVSTDKYRMNERMRKRNIGKRRGGR
jgi:hypothetical protein